jgi:cell division protease FtsH
LEVFVSPARNRSSFFIVFLIIAVLTVVIFSSGQQSFSQDVFPINQVADYIRNGQIEKVTATGEDGLIRFSFKNGGDEGVTYQEPGTTLVEQLSALGLGSEELSYNNVAIEVEPPSAWSNFLSFFLYFLPILVLVGLFYFVFRQAQGSNNAAMSFGKSKARMFTGDHPTVTFDDVAGADEAKEELSEIVEFLQEPEKFISLGARIPKGVLLIGPPGTGKTLMAKAISGEAGVPFFSISGSEFVEMFVGVGASRVRDLFDQAKRHSPCIVFVDEIDAVGRQRGSGLGGSHDEREQTLNQMLVEMDGFDTDTNIIMIAATNRPDILDPALLRPGRFDRQVTMDRPDKRGREGILKVHVKGKPLDPSVDLAVLAAGTPGFVGADLENMVNEGAILAARRNKKVIGQDEFQEAIERIIAGPERKSRLITEGEKKIIAYHEAGHAIVANAMADADPVHKITIIGRGRAGGYTLTLPQDDTTLQSRNQLFANIVVYLGGRAAEEIIFNDITSGAYGDIQQVTRIARQMVTQLGMSDELGPLMYGKKEEMIFLGREISEQRNYSEAVAERIDQEVRELVNTAYQRALDILTQYRDKLDAVAERLLEIETMSKDEFQEIFPTPELKTGGTPVMQGA